MPKPKIEFAIDDAKSINANLQSFGSLLERLDPDLAAILGPRLSEFSASEPNDLHGIWDALLEATAPGSKEDDVPARDAA
jgi:hypothetical protein